MADAQKWVPLTNVANAFKALHELSIRMARVQAAQRAKRAMAMVKALVPEVELHG